VEVMERTIPATSANEAALRAALEAAGVEFTNGDQPGVRLPRAAAARSAEAAAASKPSVAAKAARGQIANAPRKNDRILASRVAFGDRCARTAFELADVKFIDKKGGLGVRLRGKA
jgi:CTP:molybdopterin cytidylyltransferase MocA